MMNILYLISFLGSFSLGYSILRIGFPEIQKDTLTKKIGIGYITGLVILLPAIATIFLNLEIFFFLFVIGAYGFLATIMFIVRIYYNKIDDVELVEPKENNYIPKKALAPEEKEQQENDETNDNAGYSYENKKLDTTDDSLDNYSEYKMQKAKELNVEDKIKKANHSTTGKSEHGLFVKEANINNKKTQRQIFKEKEPNVINKLRQKTIGEETKTNEETNNENQSLTEKDKIMNKLKELAKKDNKKKLDEQINSKTNLDDDLESLNEIDEEF